VSKNRLKTKAGVCVCVALCAILMAAVAQLLTAAPEPQAAQIARGMMQAMGGEALWKQARYVRFDFTLKLHNQIKFDRAHLWDKQTGRYRLEDKSTTGRFAVVLFNLGDQQGAAYVEGKKLEGPAAASAVKGAHRAHHTDVNWLDLPWNWLSPGFHLKYVGEKNLKGQAFDLVEVTVDEYAGAPAMRYNSYVSRRSHLLEFSSVGPETSLWDWQYTAAGGVRLASDHTNTERQASISMGNVKVFDRVDDAFLTDPAHKLAALQ
jgi:hypothetical protein